MHSIFSIPELFERIASAIDDKKTLAASATTCQTFKDTMLNVLWSDLDSILPLVQLFKPLQLVLDNTQQVYNWGFQDIDIGPEDWDRFAQYSHLVKRLRHVSTANFEIAGSTYPLGSSIFQTIGLTRPHDLRLLPNLYSLNLDISTPSCFMNILPFIDGDIQFISITFGQSLTTQSMNSIFSTIVRRLPFIRSVRIEDQRPIQDVETPLVAFLEKLESVIEINLPRYYLTTQALEALSHHLTLEKISSCYNSPLSASEDRLVLEQMELSGFRKLTKLAIAANLETLLPLMVETEWAPGLADIEVTSRSEATAWYLEKFCATLAGSRKNIRSLHLDLYNPSSTTPSTPLEFKAIEPLLGCRAITKFFLRHRYAIRIDLVDLERLLTEWAQLLEVSICADPSQNDQQEAGFPLTVLNAFSQVRPNITHIGLHFDTSIIPTWLPGLPRLDHIKVLHVGWSKPTNKSEIGMFLASLCNGVMELKVGDSDISPTINSASHSPPTAEWNEVTNLFRDFARMRERALMEIAPKAASKGGWAQVKKDVTYVSKQERAVGLDS